MKPNKKMPRKTRLAKCGVAVTVLGRKAQLFCGAAKFISQRLSVIRFEFGAYIKSLVGKYKAEIVIYINQNLEMM